jgi:hypothetical protein
MRTPSLAAAAAAAALALAACDDTGTEISTGDDILNDDVAALAADAVQEDLEVMNALLPVMGVAYAPVAYDVLDYPRSRTVMFYDADGEEQPAFDPLTTASIHTTLDISGEASGQDFEWSLDRTRDMWVTGLEGEETQRTWNGTGADDRSRARLVEGEVSRTYDMTGTLLVEDVVRGVPRADNPWPLSGTITRDLTIEVTNGPNGDETITRLVVITFDGTQYATLTLDGTEYEVDLTQRGRDGVHRRHHRGG